MALRDSPVKIEDAVKILTYIIGAVGFLSVVRHVSPSYSAVFAVLYALAASFEYKRSFPVPRWLLNVASLAVLFLGFARIHADDFVTPSLESLLVLLAMKFLENKRFRDFMQIYIIAVFLLAGSSLLSLDMVFLVYFVSLIFLLAVTTVLLAYYSQDGSLELRRSTTLKIALHALAIALISVPVTLFMFIILPRTSYPMLNFLNRGVAASTGFTDSVGLGKVSEIQEDATVILRANMEKVDDRLLYWRGIVLDRFDGTVWRSSGTTDMEEAMRSDIPGRRVWQVLYLEPYGNNYLFVLDRPVAVPLPGARRYRDLTFTRSEHTSKRIRYRALSALGELLPEGDIERNRYLQLPSTYTGGIRDLTERLTAGRNEQEKTGAILGFLRNGDYRYSLKGLSTSADPLDDFLFVRKRGNCEYFASAMAVMLRTAGIPARLVGGYRGGYYNDVGKYYLVTQKNAHVWVEAYIEGKGWLRLDPTPAPDDVFTRMPRDGMFVKARYFLDVFNYYWNASVINYDLEGQVSLARKLGAGLRMPSLRISADKKKAVRYALLLLAAASCLSLTYLLVFRDRRTAEEELIRAFTRKMERLGHIRARSEGLEEFAAKVDDEGRRGRTYEFVREFERCYYTDVRLTKKEVRQLRRLIKAI